MRFHLPSALRKWAGDHEVIELSFPLDLGMTIVEAFETLGREYPGIRQRVLDDQGNIRRHVNVFIDGENVRFAQGNATQVTHASEVRIYPAMSGGTPNPRPLPVREGEKEDLTPSPFPLGKGSHWKE